MVSSMLYLVLLGLSGILYVQGCKEGWSNYNGNCYIYKSTTKTQSEAKAACASLGGHLAEPRTSGENDFIESILETQGFIGYNDQKTENSFVGDYSGEAMVYKKWEGGEPNNDGSGEDCVEIYKTTGNWNDVPCDFKRAFVCEYKGCPDGWKSKDQKCYKFFSSTKTHNAAKNDCTTKGGYLAEIRSAAENSFVESISDKGFIGFNDMINEGTFVGDLSEKAMGYKNWQSGEPNNVGSGGEDCVEIYRNGKWNDVPCTYTRAYICEQRAACPSGSKLSGKKCYTHQTSAKTNAQHKTDCIAKGMYLAEPRSEAETDTIGNLINEVQSFLGFSDKLTEGSFVGEYSGLAMSYSKWQTGEPNNVGDGGEDCVEMNYYQQSQQHKWNDVPCSAKRGAVCEYSVR